jgi:hypothetical protein
MNLHLYNAGLVCAGVDLASAEPQLDLSAVTFFEPAGLVYVDT